MDATWQKKEEDRIVPWNSIVLLLLWPIIMLKISYEFKVLYSSFSLWCWLITTTILACYSHQLTFTQINALLHLPDTS